LDVYKHAGRVARAKEVIHTFYHNEGSADRSQFIKENIHLRYLDLEEVTPPNMYTSLELGCPKQNQMDAES